MSKNHRENNFGDEISETSSEVNSSSSSSVGLISTTTTSESYCNSFSSDIFSEIEEPTEFKKKNKFAFLSTPKILCIFIYFSFAFISIVALISVIFYFIPEAVLVDSENANFLRKNKNVKQWILPSSSSNNYSFQIIDKPEILSFGEGEEREYECAADCVCLDYVGKTNRRNVIPVGRMMVIGLAFFSVFAVSKYYAEKMLYDSSVYDDLYEGCLERFKDYCPSENIKIEEKDCLLAETGPGDFIDNGLLESYVELEKSARDDFINNDLRESYVERFVESYDEKDVDEHEWLLKIHTFSAALANGKKLLREGLINLKQINMYANVHQKDGMSFEANRVKYVGEEGMTAIGNAFSKFIASTKTGRHNEDLGIRLLLIDHDNKNYFSSFYHKDYFGGLEIIGKVRGIRGNSEQEATLKGIRFASWFLEKIGFFCYLPPLPTSIKKRKKLPLKFRKVVKKSRDMITKYFVDKFVIKWLDSVVLFGAGVLVNSKFSKSVHYLVEKKKDETNDEYFHCTGECHFQETNEVRNMECFHVFASNDKYEDVQYGANEKFGEVCDELMDSIGNNGDYYDNLKCNLKKATVFGDVYIC